MQEKDVGKTEYMPPLIVVYEMTEILDNLGPAASCSGYGGSVTGCQ